MALLPLSHVSILLLLLIYSLLSFPSVHPKPTTISPYLSPTILFPNYQKMISSFKIYTYPPPHPFTTTTLFTTPPASLFYASLLQSPFLTQDAEEAHLFFVPFPSGISTRSVARHVRSIRTEFPYWNRTLGADHFFLSPEGIDQSSDRNVVELKKNSVQISYFPTAPAHFIPHKDITLPAISPSPVFLLVNDVRTTTSSYLNLGYMKWKSESKSAFVDELNADSDFIVESEPSDETESVMKRSKYCLFMYGPVGDMTWMVEALASGCVPAVITDRPIQDMPLMDVLRWSEIGVFVGSGGGVRGLKEVLGGISEVRYERMKELGVTASQHLVWNDAPQPHDAFQMVMYQLWLRRHTIRYPRRELA